MVFCCTRGQDIGIAMEEICTCFTFTGIKALCSEFLILQFHLNSMYLTTSALLKSLLSLCGIFSNSFILALASLISLLSVSSVHLFKSSFNYLAESGCYRLAT